MSVEPVRFGGLQAKGAAEGSGTPLTTPEWFCRSADFRFPSVDAPLSGSWILEFLTRTRMLPSVRPVAHLCRGASLHGSSLISVQITRCRSPERPLPSAAANVRFREGCELREAPRGAVAPSAISGPSHQLRCAFRWVASIINRSGLAPLADSSAKMRSNTPSRPQRMNRL